MPVRWINPSSQRSEFGRHTYLPLWFPERASLHSGELMHSSSDFVWHVPTVPAAWTSPKKSSANPNNNSCSSRGRFISPNVKVSGAEPIGETSARLQGYAAWGRRHSMSRRCFRIEASSDATASFFSSMSDWADAIRTGTPSTFPWMACCATPS